MITFDFGAVLAEWPALLKGAGVTLGLTAVSASIGVAKGEDALRAKVNEIVAEAKASGELDRMARRWLGRPAGDLPL